MVQFGHAGVTSEYVKEMSAALGRKPSGEELVLIETRIHGVTPEYIREMKSAGYPELTAEELVKPRLHAIDADFVRSLSRNQDRNRK